jgi:hypothetical protein
MKRFLRITGLMVFLFFITIPALTGESNNSGTRSSPERNFTEGTKIVDENSGKKEKGEISRPLSHLGLVYLGQWGFYAVNQYDNIRENGSFDNWYGNMASIHMDKDSYDYNLIKHTVAGNYYFLFYRSRGYSPLNSFFLSTVSVLLFEFTIETATEKPSIQDIYQTPVMGAVLGSGVDFLSLNLIRSRYSLARFFGYLLNPFRLFGSSGTHAKSAPHIGREYNGYQVSISF